jgi:hypothetical protein
MYRVLFIKLDNREMVVDGNASRLFTHFLSAEKKRVAIRVSDSNNNVYSHWDKVEPFRALYQVHQCEYYCLLRCDTMLRLEGLGHVVWFTHIFEGCSKILVIFY